MKKAVDAVWLLVMIMAMLAVWPGNRIRYTKEVRGHAEEFQYSLALTEGNTIQQEFVPTQDDIQNVVVYFSNLPTENFVGVMHLNLLDAEGNLLAHDYIAAADMTEGYHAFRVNSKVKAGENYSFYIYSEAMPLTAPKLVYRTLSVSGPEENGTFLMNGIVFDNCTAAGGYDYGMPLRLSHILAYDTFILFIGVLVKSGIQKWQSAKIQ